MLPKKFNCKFLIAEESWIALIWKNLAVRLSERLVVSEKYHPTRHFWPPSKSSWLFGTWSNKHMGEINDKEAFIAQRKEDHLYQVREWINEHLFNGRHWITILFGSGIPSTYWGVVFFTGSAMSLSGSSLVLFCSALQLFCCLWCMINPLVEMSFAYRKPLMIRFTGRVPLSKLRKESGTSRSVSLLFLQSDVSNICCPNADNPDISTWDQDIHERAS